jgi:HK97 gp10 family phage protein
MIALDMSQARGKVTAQLHGLGKHEHEFVVEAVTEATKMAWADARLNVPVKSGELRDSIEYEVEDLAGASTVGTVRAKARYGAFVERGTGKGKAQPYLKPALAAAREWLYQELRHKFGRT